MPRGVRSTSHTRPSVGSVHSCGVAPRRGPFRPIPGGGPGRSMVGPAVGRGAGTWLHRRGLGPWPRARNRTWSPSTRPAGPPAWAYRSPDVQGSRGCKVTVVRTVWRDPQCNPRMLLGHGTTQLWRTNSTLSKNLQVAQLKQKDLSGTCPMRADGKCPDGTEIQPRQNRRRVPQRSLPPVRQGL